MDVDNLGKNFQDIETPAELSQKSQHLNLFFKVYLNNICTAKLNGITPTDIVEKKYATRENKGRNVSVIYAGGDDLFIVGAWDETAELAFDIQQCFTAFAPSQTISGGLTLHQPKFPLYQMARKSGEAESVAKNKSGQTERLRSQEGKNRIALFYSESQTEIERKKQMESVNKTDDRIFHSIKWEDYPKVIDITKFLKSYAVIKGSRLVMEDLPNGLNYQLLNIVHEWHENGVLYIPHFLWLLKKHTKKLDHKPEGTDFIKRQFTPSNLPMLHLPLMWIELLKRGK